MSYYLKLANELEDNGVREGARVIRELYEAKVELEALVKRTSDARDLALRQRDEARESEKCWTTNAKNLQVGYNELDARLRKLTLQEEPTL